MIEPPEGGLTQRSKVLLYQTRMVEELGAVTAETMAQVDAALRRALDL